MLVQLFRTFCTNMYGCELWSMSDEKKAARELCVAYHSCLKKLTKVPRWSRNHDLCDELNLLTCPMLVAYRQLLFWMKTKTSVNSLVYGLANAGWVDEVGLLARNHRRVRTEYDLIQLDLGSVNRADLRHVFATHLTRFVQNRRENSAGISISASVRT